MAKSRAQKRSHTGNLSDKESQKAKILARAGQAKRGRARSQAEPRGTAGNRSWLRRICKVLLITLGLGVGALILLALNIYLYGYRVDDIEADAAVVLGAAVWQDRLSPVFRERVNHAIKLYQTGKVKKLIFTGGKGEEQEDAESIVARDYAIKAGVPARDILVEEVSRKTYENLYYARELAAEHKLKKLLIISDPIHMRRAMYMARDLGLDAYTSPTQTSRYQGWRSKIEFLWHETYYSIVYFASYLL